jgi:hypothetical protein
MQWEYKAMFTQKVGGNCTGMAVIECAINNLFESLLPENDADPASVTLTNDAGDTVLSEDDCEREVEWLNAMVVSACIVAWEPPTLNEVRAMHGAKPIEGGDRPYDPQ